MWRRRQKPAGDDIVSFVCNICSSPGIATIPELHREESSCPQCRSNVRFRGVIAALSSCIHGAFLTLDDFPARPDIVGLGMSDWEGYAIRLRRVFGYDNTYYDEHIRLDITAPVPHALSGSCDFVISSDVLEHVAPPYELALAHIRQLLKPGGLLILTVPLKPDGSTIEHFPDLFAYEIVTLGTEQVLVNRTEGGALQVFDNLVFHGGPGVTLEMRMISVPDLMTSLDRAGFVDVRPFDHAVPEHGVVWIEPHTWPILANAPG